MVNIKGIKWLSDKATIKKLKDGKLDDSTLELIRKHNNPNNESTGQYTSRCRHCQSNNIWKDANSYGCNLCGANFVH